MAGALKNVYAIAVGMGYSLGIGENTRAMVIARAVREMSKLGEAMGAQASLMFTSPPYGNQRDYTTGGVTDWDALMQGVFGNPLAEPGVVAVTPGIGAIMMEPVSVCHHVSTIGAVSLVFLAFAAAALLA